MAGILFIISAPSGSGKSTLVSELRKQLSGIEFSISWTTRTPRGSELDGVEYHFTSRDDFERKIAAGEFLEHAEVFGNYYGTARSSLDEARRDGHDLVLDIDVQGAAQVRSRMPEAVSIFILPPNPKVLRTRLRNRSRAEGEVNEAELYKRLSEAAREIENYRFGPGRGATGSHRTGRAVLPEQRTDRHSPRPGAGSGRLLPSGEHAGTAQACSGGLRDSQLPRPPGTALRRGDR